MSARSAPSPIGEQSAAPAALLARRVAIRGLRSRVSGYRIALIGLLLLVLAFYIWTAASTSPFEFSPHNNNDPYNELTTGFLHGHTYLPITPSAGLLHLKDPYDPSENGPYTAYTHDLALYHGRFYLTWGPTPVLTLFAPFRLTGLRMSQSFAVVLYGFLGLLCAVLLLHAVVRRFVPRTPRWLLLVASAGLALTNTVPFLLRRPAEYEVAVSSGYCFEMAGLLLMLTAILGPVVRRRRLALGSLCLGLAVGARPDLVLGGLIAVAVGVWLVRRRNQPRGILVYALGPLVLCGLLLAAYNDARFGSLINFGDRYALAGVDQLHAPFDKVQWILPGLLSYLYVPVRLSLTFPHVFLQNASADPITLPSQYFGSSKMPYVEPAGGVFTSMPITLLLLAFPAFWWRRRLMEKPLLLIAGGLTAVGLAIAVLLTYSVFATTERYEVDFVTFLLLASFLLWAVWLDRWRPRSLGRRVVAIGGVILTLVGAVIGVATSFIGYLDLLQAEHPSTFYALEDATGPLVTLATMVLGKPEITRVQSGPVVPSPTGGGPFSQHGSGAWLGTTPTTVTIVAPSSGTVGLFATATAGAGAPPASSMVILVRNGTRRTSAVPVIAAVVRMPISVHMGLNRVQLTLAGHATSLDELLLSNLRVSG